MATPKIAVTEAQIEKLPKWAQDHIAMLERHVAERDRLLWKVQDTVIIEPSRAELDNPPFPVYEWGMRHLKGNAGPQTYLRDLKASNPHFNLGFGERVSLGRKHQHKKTIDLRIDEETHQLRVSASGTLLIRHGSSNTCTLDVE